MKLYRLNSNNCWSNYFVVSNSREEAFKQILNTIKCPIDSSIYDQFKDVDVNDPKSFPEYYTLDEHEINEVIEVEIG